MTNEDRACEIVARIFNKKARWSLPYAKEVMDDLETELSKELNDLDDGRVERALGFLDALRKLNAQLDAPQKALIKAAINILEGKPILTDLKDGP